MEGRLKLPDIWRALIGPLMVGYMLRDAGAQLVIGAWWCWNDGAGERFRPLFVLRLRLSADRWSRA